MTTNTDARWIPDTSTFAARLVLVRWKMGWNRAEASKECNLASPNAWATWEEGSMPRQFVENVNRIVLRTKVDRMWLMTGEGSPEAPKTDPSDYLAPVVALRPAA
jgi:hypothetical protein